MTCSISTDWTFSGLRAIAMRNEDLSVVVLPDYGAKILEYKFTRPDRDLLYHNPRVEIRTPVFGVNVDNWWHGGIDECIPTGQPCRYKGEDYPYLGELWSLPWGFEMERACGKEVVVHLFRKTIISPLLVERWMSLRDGETIVRMKHKITNLGYSDFQFLWGLHPGVAIGPASRIDVPSSSEVVVEDSQPDNRLGSPGTRYRWPYAKKQNGEVVDMRLVQSPQTQTVDLHYATKLADGWLAVTDTSTNLGFGIAFPKDVFKSIWLWLVYGGWRGLYCAAVEAWTGFPGRLDEAVRQGNFANLRAGESLSCETTLVAFKGVSSVKRITSEGCVEQGE